MPVQGISQQEWQYHRKIVFVFRAKGSRYEEMRKVTKTLVSASKRRSFPGQSKESPVCRNLVLEDVAIITVGQIAERLHVGFVA